MGLDLKTLALSKSASKESKPNYTKEEIGLDNVDNTSDIDKPVSKAQQAALDKKVDKTTVATSSALGLVKSGTDITVDSNGNMSVNDNLHKHTVSNISDLTATATELNVLDGITASTEELNYSDGVTSNIQTQLNSKAPTESPTLTGTPKAPTASAGANSTQISNTAFVQTSVSNHNTSTSSHEDIRDLVSVLTTRLNALADSDDTTLDQLSEIVAYIKSNRTIIENVTTGKVNVSDIIDNLTSTATNKPLSAKQGKVLKDLIGSLTSVVNEKVDKIEGKGLSANDYTTTEKNKLAGIASGAEVNVQPDWNVADTNSDAYIKNKPTIPTSLPANGGTSNYTNYVNTNILAANTDLNNVTTPGFYYCPADATVATFVNCPINRAFFMIVGKHAGVYQEFIEYFTANPKRYMRNYYANSGGWGSWCRVYTTADAPPNTTYSAGAQLSLSNGAFRLAARCSIPSGNDWNNATEDGFYMGNNFANAPVSEIWLYGIVLSHTSTYVRQILYKFSLTSDVTSTDSDRYERIRLNGVWGTWVNTSVRKAVPSDAKFTDTTYSTVSKTAAGLCPKLPNETTTTKYLRQDGTWVVPPATANLTKSSVIGALGWAQVDGAMNSYSSDRYDGVCILNDTVNRQSLYNKLPTYKSHAMLINGEGLDIYNTPSYTVNLFGDYNKTGSSKDSYEFFTVGNGSSSSSRSNALRLTYEGNLYYGKGCAAGADYAEFFEWSDGNPSNEDRCGLFVTFDFDKDYDFSSYQEIPKIRPAQPGEFILGVISGNPAIVGNADEEWKGRYIRDEFDRILYGDILYEQEIELEEVETGEYRTEIGYDEDDNEIEIQVPITEIVAQETGKYVRNTRNEKQQSPDYNPEQDYISRFDRFEWDTACMLGVISVRDDSSCIVGRYCKCGTNGVATLADERGFDTYLVVRRLTDNVVKIVFK